MTIKFIILATALLVQLVASAPSSNSNNDDDRHQLLRIAFTSEGQVDRILTSPFRTVDFWTEPILNGYTDVMVGWTEAEAFAAILGEANIKYQISLDDVEVVIQQQEFERISETKVNSGMTWTTYHNYETINKWLDDLQAANPTKVEIVTKGHSFEGRPMRFLHLSSDLTAPKTTKKTVFFTSGIHACEWIAPATTTYAINELINNPAYSSVLEKVDLWVILFVNPDGYHFSHQSIFNRLWRKSRSMYPLENDRTVSCPGVDLNRNFDFHWGNAEGANASSTDPCLPLLLNNYRGSKAFSEPETRAIRDFVDEYLAGSDKCLYANFHSYMQKIMYPWGWTKNPTPDEDKFKALADAAAAAVYSVHQSVYSTGASSKDIYYTDGTDQDWVYGTGRFPYSFTMELRDTGKYGFLLPPDQIIPTAEETLKAMLVFLQACY